MTNEEFKQLLKKAGLTKKEFAKQLGISPNTVNGWGVSKDKPFPYWVETWLNNYIKAKTLDNVKDVICTDESAPIGEKDGQ